GWYSARQRSLMNMLPINTRRQVAGCDPLILRVVVRPRWPPRRYRPAERFGEPAGGSASFPCVGVGVGLGPGVLDALKDVFLGHPELPLEGPRMLHEGFGEILAEFVAREHVLARFGGADSSRRDE